jgi:hypothetical protein
MKVGDLVKSRRQSEGFELCSIEWLGLVMEAEENSSGVSGHWVEYFEDPGGWVWYSIDGHSLSEWDVEVISENR